MSEMVERVARAIIEESFDSIGPSEAEAFARAAIAAMREPTKEMAERGNTEADDQMDSGFSSNCDGERSDYDYLKSGAASEIYMAMIDEALKP